MNMEKPEEITIRVEQETQPSGSIAVEGGLEKDGVSIIKSKISELRKTKEEFTARQKEIEGWGDITSVDRNIIKKNNEFIINQTDLIQTEINKQFDLLEKEIMANGDVKSSTGIILKPFSIIKNILRIRESENINKDELSDLLKNITRTNDYRSKVSKLMGLVIDLKEIK